MTGGKRMVNSDRLGAIGENLFQKLCLAANLTCNIPKIDRNGWDAIVEFDFDCSSIKETLDKRVIPTSCYVQIKTMWEDNNSFRLRLSAAERLAKEPRPSFILVLKLDQQLNAVSAYLIHVYDLFSELILKNLRVLEKVGSKNVNKKYIYVEVHKFGDLIEVNPDVLKASFLKHAGSNMTVYGVAKEKMLKNIGYATKPFEMSAMLAVENMSDLVDGFLGLQTLRANRASILSPR